MVTALQKDGWTVTEDPLTLDTPEQAAEFIVPMCMPSWAETGKLYDYPSRTLLGFRAPA